MYAPQPPSSVPQVQRQELWDFGGRGNGVEAFGDSDSIGCRSNGSANRFDTSTQRADLNELYADFDSLSESMVTCRYPTSFEASTSAVSPKSPASSIGGAQSRFPPNHSGCDDSYGRENRSNGGGDLNGYRQFDDRALGVAGYDGGIAETFSMSRGGDRVNADWGAADSAGGDGYDAMYGYEGSQLGQPTTSHVYRGPGELQQRTDAYPACDVTEAGGYGVVDETRGMFQDNRWIVDDQKPVDEGSWQRQTDDGEPMRSAWDSTPPAPPHTATDCPVSFLDYGSRVPPVAPPLPPPGPPPVLMTSSSPAAMSKDFKATSRFDSPKVMRLIT